MGYYLLTLDVTTELFNLYIDTIKTYYNKRGSVCYKIIDNPELNSIFEKNEKIIKDILQIKCDLLEYWQRKILLAMQMFTGEENK